MCDVDIYALCANVIDTHTSDHCLLSLQMKHEWHLKEGKKLSLPAPPNVLTPEEMMCIAVPNDVLEVRFHFRGHCNGSKVDSDAVSKDSGLSLIMNLDGMYVMYHFDCIGEAMSLVHMKCIIHYLE